MTRRIAVLVGFLGAVCAIVLGVPDVLDRDVRLPAADSLPSLSAPGGPDLGRPDLGSADLAVPELAVPELDSPDLGGVDPGDEDGDLDGRATTVDSGEAAVSRLDPELLAALRAAAADAADDGVEVRLSSGWRSRTYQQRLLDEAIATYGSREEALRWVSTPDTSAHTKGAAVDVSPTDAAYWMSEHGAAFGLCQTYANEIWHYELLTSPGGICPVPRVDSSS